MIIIAAGIPKKLTQSHTEVFLKNKISLLSRFVITVRNNAHKVHRSCPSLKGIYY